MAELVWYIKFLLYVLFPYLLSSTTSGLPSLIHIIIMIIIIIIIIIMMMIIIILLFPQVGKFLTNGYGLTEAFATVSGNSPVIGFKLGSVGRILPYINLKVGVLLAVSP